MSTSTFEPYTNLDAANLRIQSLETFIRNEGEHRRKLIGSTEHSLQWHRDETARYRKIATDSTDRLFRQYREFTALKFALGQIESVLTTRPALDRVNDNVPAAVDSCLNNTASLQTEQTMHDMVNHLAAACMDAGLPVQPK